jgi:hypothetical protein
VSAPDPLDSPIGGETGRSVCKDCRNVQWCIPTKQCLIERLQKSKKEEPARYDSVGQMLDAWGHPDTRTKEPGHD